MKRLFVLLPAALLLLSISACKKESLTADAGSAEKLAAPAAENAQNNPKNECRLTGVEWPYGNYNFQYNANGLCSQVNISGLGYFQQTYNTAGRLTQSRYYFDGMLETTIVFQYGSNGLANKETRYIGNTTDKSDEIFITRNNQGLITRMESFMNNYYITAQYSPQGNNTSWQVYVASQLAYDVQVQYRQSIKNQYKAVRGIEYGFPFVNAFMFQSKFTPASEKFTLYDEYGNPYVLYDYDPARSLTIAGFQNYPVSSDWFDHITQGWIMYNFYYGDCSPSSTGKLQQNPVAAGMHSLKDGSLENLLLMRPAASPAKTLLAAKNAIIKKIKAASE